MPIKKKKKKAISSTLKKKLEVIKIGKQLRLRLKKRKKQHAETKKSLAQMMREDAGKGLENLDKANYVNVFEIARNIRDFKQLEDFIDIYIPALTAADIAVLAAQHAEDKWNIIKILKDPDYQGSVFMLLDAIDNIDGGAVKVFNDFENKKNNPLTEVIKDTSYRIPETLKTFQWHISMFKDHFGMKRKTASGIKRHKDSAADIAYEKEMQKKLEDPDFWKFGKKT